MSAKAIPVTLRDAIYSSITHAQLDAIQGIEESAALNRTRAASALPNPSIYYEHEEFGEESFAEKTSESAIGISTNLDFIWKRSKRIASAERLNEINHYQLIRLKQEISLETARRFVDYKALTLEKELLMETKGQFSKALQIANAAVDSGDISKLELRRIQLASGLLQSEILNVNEALSELQATIAGLTGEPQIEPDTAFEIPAPVYTSKPEAVKDALENRPEIAAAESYLEMIATQQQIARYNTWPSIDLDIARIENEIGQNGTFMGLSMELPLFAKERANARLTATEVSKASIALEQLKRRISREASSAYAKWAYLNANVPLNTEQPGDQEDFLNAFLLSSISSFTQRDISILEHLDAINGYLDTMRNQIHIIRKLQLAALDLYIATASELTTN